MKSKLIAAVSVLSLFLGTQTISAGSETAMRPVQVATGSGGSVVEFARRVSNARIGGHAVTFSGRCASACTLYLAMPRSSVCLRRGASFEFHRPYGASDEFNAWATNYMLGHYPSWVLNWIAVRGGLSDRLLRMDYTYASRFLPTCQTVTARQHS